MRELDVGAIPVATNGALVGMVTDRDITIRCVADHESISNVKAKDVMTSGVVYCRDNQDIEDAVHIMKGKQIRRLPVLDEAMQMADDRHGEPRRRLARAAARSPARWRKPSQPTIPKGKSTYAAARSSSGFHCPSEASPFMRAR